MKVSVDPELCEANGVCVSIAPEVFELQADDILLVVNRAPSDDLRERLEDAVDGCPRAALRIDED
jgi:ferredoxin